MFAIVGAEYVMKLLPKGTHEYSKFIRPSELDIWARQAGLEIIDIAGITYNPFTKMFRSSRDVDVNYMAHYKKPSS
jgi:2-polyprenyl-6-hydroxyphenyl methylase/3-demethylubiquinone-9 3-methyltransferase